MKMRVIFTNILAILVMVGAVTFATFEYVKSQEHASTDRYQVTQLQKHDKQIEQTRITNSFLRIRIRALRYDPKAINAVVRKRIGVMRPDEVYIPPSEL